MAAGVLLDFYPVLGLPYGTRSFLFHLDGVLTKTAKVHAAACNCRCDLHGAVIAEAIHKLFNKEGSEA